MQQLQADNMRLKCEMDALSGSLKKCEAMLDSTKSELKMLVQKSNIRLDEMMREKELIYKELLITKEDHRKTKEYSELEVTRLANQVAIQTIFLFLN